jgi:hypothetical protein
MVIQPGRNEEVGPPKGVRLSELTPLLSEITPLFKNFMGEVDVLMDQEIKKRTEKLGLKITKDEREEARTRLKRIWTKGIEPLKSYFKQVKTNEESLMLVPQRCKEGFDEETGRRTLTLRLLNQENITLRKGKEPYYDLVIGILTEEGEGPGVIEGARMIAAEDLALALDEERLLRIKIYTTRIIEHADGQVDRYPQTGIIMERGYNTRDSSHTMKLFYSFVYPTEIRVPIKGGSVNEEDFTKAVEQLKQVYEERNE